MPLVDYASSDDESDGEGQTVENVEPKLENEKPVKEKEAEKNANNIDNTQLFSALPKPRKTFSFLEDDNKLSKLLLNKNSLLKENVKITVPSPSDFEDDQEPVTKKIKPSMKSVGLFSILPPPKNPISLHSKKNLVPDIVSKKRSNPISNKVETNSNALGNKLFKQIDEDEDDDTVVGTSFFGSSLLEQSTPAEPETLNTDSIVNNDISGNIVADCNPPEQNYTPSILPQTKEPDTSYSSEPGVDTEVVSAEDNPFNLDEKALQILCGNKKKRHQMPMNIIDLSGDEVLPDSKEWLLKQFTEEKTSRGHSHKKHHGPSSVSRRKHQITYLAYQAKEQELELQNQWAQNRISRKQTQSKYGF